jgi:hypothetical protein
MYVLVQQFVHIIFDPMLSQQDNFFLSYVSFVLLVLQQFQFVTFHQVALVTAAIEFQCQRMELRRFVCNPAKKLKKKKGHHVPKRERRQNPSMEKLRF